jgi:ABC-2 type transport system permease protein
VRTLLGVEMRRCLARRLSRALIGVAVLASVVAGATTFANTEEFRPEGSAERRARRDAAVAECTAAMGSGEGSSGGVVIVGRGGRRASPEELRRICQRSVPPDVDQSLHLTDLWSADGSDDSVWAVTSVFLAIGALIGAASMVGAEWKAGTMTTVLTWEPRRARLAVAKLAAVGLLAAAVSVALQLVLAGALLPTMAAKGTTSGADGEWLRAAAGGLGRSGALAALAAVVGAGVAMVGRSTAAALGAAFAYLAIGESILRAWKPEQSRWLLGENATIFLTGRRLDGAPFERPVALATVTLVGYALAVVAAATASLRSRDVAA